jgi:hypothetical protein
MYETTCSTGVTASFCGPAGPGLRVHATQDMFDQSLQCGFGNRSSSHPIGWLTSDAPARKSTS